MTDMRKIYKHLALVLCAVLFALGLQAQERVYVSTDKECYLAGENMWLSVYCMDGKTGEYSNLSKVAYLEFHNLEGMASTIKVPLKDGRGCGRFQIPLGFATGNYSIVAYTARYGGNSIGEFNGKVVSVFNTLSSQRVKDGVAVVGEDGSLYGEGKVKDRCNWLSLDVDAAQEKEGAVPVTVKNLSGKGASVSISVYHLDELVGMAGEYGYDKSSLLSRKGDFEVADEVDYAGEVIKVQRRQIV